jgi:hypothetical protein
VSEPNRLREETQPNQLGAGARPSGRDRPSTDRSPTARSQPGTHRTNRLLLGCLIVFGMLVFLAVLAIPLSDFAVNSTLEASVGPVATASAAGSAADLVASPELSGVSSLPNLSDVTVGQCFREILASNDPTMTLGEQIVPCAERHEDEMFATATYPAAPGASFPPGNTLDDYANHLCTSAFAAYVGIPAESSVLGWAYTTPTDASWSSDGDRWIGCWVESTPPAAPLVGSVRGSKR